MKSRRTYYSHTANTREKESDLINADVDQIIHEETGGIINKEIILKKGTQIIRETQIGIHVRGI